MILSGVVSVLLRVIGFREELQEAIESKRLHDQLVPEGVQYEGQSVLTSHQPSVCILT